MTGKRRLSHLRGEREGGRDRRLLGNALMNDGLVRAINREMVKLRRKQGEWSEYNS